MTDHRHTLSTFLRTDLFRLEAALEGVAWSETVAARLADHLRFALQVQAVYLEGTHPRDESLRAAVEAIAPASADEALALWAERTESLLAAVERTGEARLHAPVLDPHERGLTVLGHLYDLTRASAAVVAWLQGAGMVAG